MRNIRRVLTVFIPHWVVIVPVSSFNVSVNARSRMESIAVCDPGNSPYRNLSNISASFTNLTGIYTIWKKMGNALISNPPIIHERSDCETPFLYQPSKIILFESDEVFSQKNLIIHSRKHLSSSTFSFSFSYRALMTFYARDCVIDLRSKVFFWVDSPMRERLVWTVQIKGIFQGNMARSILYKTDAVKLISSACT